MPLNHDEMDRRRKRREEAKKQQKKARRRLILLLILALVILTFGGVSIYRMAKRSQDTLQAAPTAQTTEPPTQATESTSARAVKDPITKIHIRAVGDLNITNSTVDAGITATGYDFTRAFRDVAAELGAADVTVLNLEGNFCGEPYGTETASAPPELLRYPVSYTHLTLPTLLRV